MFYLSKKHHFDTMFVILCVIAGATSHTVSNTSKTPVNQLNNHYHASFIDFILDVGLIELLHTSHTMNRHFETQYSSDYKPSATKVSRQHPTVCTSLSNLLSDNQMKLCAKHQDVFETILPKVVQLTRDECIRITRDLKWNCSAMDYFLDRSNPLALTKEAALVRSLLNASMMYLVVQACTSDQHRSCGCLANSDHESEPIIRKRRYASASVSPEKEADSLDILQLEQKDLSISELSKLDSGSPLRLTKSTIKRQVCIANSAFAYAFAKAFIDSDDDKALNKAYRILNEDQIYSKYKTSRISQRRSTISDMRDIALVKWTKSAIFLHNNHLGRQVVRESMYKQCRCHGLSGVCQYQTCWDQLLDFSTIAYRLKSYYLTAASKVEIINSGTPDQPDLSLRPRSTSSDQQTSASLQENTRLLSSHLSNSTKAKLSNPHSNTIVRVKPMELIYLHDSPEYCDPQPAIHHFGTQGRPCTPMNNLTLINKTSKKNFEYTEMARGKESFGNDQENLDGTPGSCKQLCCNRGFYSKLVLDMVTCNCRFKFCCRVECDHCLRQRMQHYCL